jgi:hypothetical protein
MSARMPAGTLLDSIHSKPLAAVGAISEIALAAAPAPAVVLAALSIQAVASGVLTPAVAAITLGKRQEFGQAAGYNVRYAPIGLGHRCRDNRTGRLSVITARALHLSGGGRPHCPACTRLAVAREAKTRDTNGRDQRALSSGLGAPILPNPYDLEAFRAHQFTSWPIMLYSPRKARRACRRDCGDSRRFTSPSRAPRRALA